MKKKELVVNTKWCKACGICAAFCPKQVLVVRGTIEIAHPDDCIKCGQCEQRCPDYAIYLKEVDENE